MVNIKKKPSTPGMGYLGRQTLGKRIANGKYSDHKPMTQPELPTPEEFYTTEINGLLEYQNSWAWGCCPFHPDSNPSFTVNLETGAFRCMSSNCGVRGGNIVSFVSQLYGIGYREALNYLEDRA